jgi:hypothetical protein
MKTALILLILIALLGTWYIVRPQEPADCITARGIICEQKAR